MSMNLRAARRPEPRALALWVASICGVFAVAAPATAAPPEIRTHALNAVPSCVTPGRLDAFIRTRNDTPLAKFSSIGTLYKKHGDALRIRWDYAFFQMVIETNYLMFRRGDGKQGDVSPRQNNFAGIGATGGGVPGDSFADVSSGVLAQMQHLVAYSGERVDNPIAPRTQFAQDHIIAISLKLRRPVTFADLRNRWAADRNYARSIETIAERFREQFCTPNSAEAARPDALASVGRVPSPQPARRPAAVVAPAVSAGVAQTRPMATCRVLAASFGGRKAVLIRADTPAETQFTALTVIEGFERSMVDTYVRSRAPGGHAIGEFATSEAAMARARELCPSAT
jgi:hypothetical protein